MKVLVSTCESQGKRKNDFCYVPEGEFVRLGMECDGGKPDDSCGCSRSMVGMTCAKGTTTMKVVEMPAMTPALLKDELLASLISSGWAKPGDTGGAKWAKEDAGQLIRIANGFLVGDIVEKRGRSIQVRTK
jgi:hypothetical protein